MRGLLREGVAVKYGVIEQMRQDYAVPPMCRLLGVSVSGYYAWRKRPASPRAQQEPRLEAEVLAAHQRTRESFGPERLQKHLDGHGVRVGVHRIKRLRKKLGLRCRQKRKFKATTNSKHDLPVAPNLLNQNFKATAPNQAWCGDITYIATDEGWLYLAGLKDLFSGELVGYAMSERMTKHLVMQALFRAVTSQRPPAGLVHHTDRGSQLRFKGSLQHLLKEVSNGTTTGLGFGTDRKTNNAIARQARCQSARDKASVLDLCRARHGERGCGARVWRVPTFGAKMVS
jgi:putative transposase